jgi:hypothetical protein
VHTIILVISIPCSGTSSYKGHFSHKKQKKKKKKDASVVTQKKNQESPASFRYVRLHTEQLLFQVLNVDGSCSLNRAELENISTPSNSVTEHSELWTNRETLFKPCRSIYRNRKAKCLRKIDVRTVAY